MKPLVTLLLIFTCSALPVSAQSQTAQEEKPKEDRAQLVSTADIVKIDTKKKTLQVREIVLPRADSRRPASDTRGPDRGGDRRRSGGRGGVGFPGGGGGRGGRPPGGGQASTPTKEFKVFVSGDTVYKFAQATIDFSDLHVGDRITVTGLPKGTKGDIDARTIDRQ